MSDQGSTSGDEPVDGGQPDPGLTGADEPTQAMPPVDAPTPAAGVPIVGADGRPLDDQPREPEATPPPAERSALSNPITWGVAILLVAVAAVRALDGGGLHGERGVLEGAVGDDRRPPAGDRVAAQLEHRAPSPAVSRARSAPSFVAGPAPPIRRAGGT